MDHAEPRPQDSKQPTGRFRSRHAERPTPSQPPAASHRLGDKRTCAYCVHANWLTNRWPGQLLCVNNPDTPGKIKEVIPSSTCRNFFPRREPAVRLAEPKPPNDKVRYIALTKGKFAIVDAEDYDRLMRHKWTAVCFGTRFYAQRNGGGHSIMMHREIMNAPKGMVVDHINGNGLDNRKCNLRICTQGQNILNSRPRGGSSQFKGVSYDKSREKYWAFVWENRKCVMLGRYDDEIDAAHVRDYRAVEIGGLYAWLNFPDEWPQERRETVYAEAQARRCEPRPGTQRRKGDKRKTKRSTTKVTKTTKKARRSSTHN